MAAPRNSGQSRVYCKPGIHSYNLQRRLRSTGPAGQTSENGGFPWVRRVLLLLGLAGIGLYGYSVAEESIYQAYANWAFEQEIAGHEVTFWDYLGRLTGLGRALPVEQSPKTGPEGHRPSPGEMLGKVMIPRLNMSVSVLEGVDDATLRRSAGHVPTTALPGEIGNFSIAAHRDALFRPLKDIQVGDEVQFETAQKNLVFRVVSTRIVKPTDVSVLAPEGDARLLTMITCYPFYYLGSAPKRFIVTARLGEQAKAATGSPVPVQPPPVRTHVKGVDSAKAAGAAASPAPTGSELDTAQAKKRGGYRSKHVQAFKRAPNRLHQVFDNFFSKIISNGNVPAEVRLY